MAEAGSPSLPESSVATAPWSRLDATIEGRVVQPGDLEYATVRKGPIARFHDIRPAAIVQCRSAGDVAAAVTFAARRGVVPVVRSGGHSFAGYSIGPGMVIDVRSMRAVSVADRVATVGAGARLGEVYDTLDRVGLTIPAGCGPTVGVAGLTLGGGFGILGRSHGLTADHLTAAEVVLADGRIVSCDADREPDLLWALRGAGAGGFGVVTSLTFRSVPAPKVTCFHLTWSPGHVADVIDAWQAWAPAAPDALAASLLVTVVGTGAPGVDIVGAMVAGEAETDRELAELAAHIGADPLTRMRKTMPYRDAKRHLAKLGDRFESRWIDQIRGPAHSHIKSEYFRRRLPKETIVALVERLTTAPADGQVRQLDFTPWAGAYNRTEPDDTAFAHRGAIFLLKHELIVDPTRSDLSRKADAEWLWRSWETVHPFGTGGVYPNFPDPDLDDAGHAYYVGNHRRLATLKARYDPANIFRSPPAIVPSSAHPVETTLARHDPTSGRRPQ